MEIGFRKDLPKQDAICLYSQLSNLEIKMIFIQVLVVIHVRLDSL